MTIDMGLANAAASVAALIQLQQCDLRLTYFLIAGIGALERFAIVEDSDAAEAHWMKYSQLAARTAAQVSICNTLTSGTSWHGTRIAKALEA